ncbi:hypothetical protein B0H14DRAFT_2569208 [Mycena olivaceomarginata]|nr:hypothetical protein B0H14DRAFT_2569208 [Mycena olivaceomarginata]
MMWLWPAITMKTSRPILLPTSTIAVDGHVAATTPPRDSSTGMSRVQMSQHRHHPSMVKSEIAHATDSSAPLAADGHVAVTSRVQSYQHRYDPSMVKSRIALLPKDTSQQLHRHRTRRRAPPSARSIDAQIPDRYLGAPSCHSISYLSIGPRLFVTLSLHLWRRFLVLPIASSSFSSVATIHVEESSADLHVPKPPRWYLPQAPPLAPAAPRRSCLVPNLLNTSLTVMSEAEIATSLFVQTGVTERAHPRNAHYPYSFLLGLVVVEFVRRSGNFLETEYKKTQGTAYCKDYVTDSVNFVHYSTLVLQRVPDESFHSQILSAKRVKFHLAIPLIWIRKGSPTFFSRFSVRQACNDRRYTGFAGLNGTRNMSGFLGREGSLRHVLLTGFGNLGQDSRWRRPPMSEADNVVRLAPGAVEGPRRTRRARANRAVVYAGVRPSRHCT